MADETNEQVENKPRSIDEIIDLPYSELSDEEIELVINFKTEVRLRDAEHEQKMQVLNDAVAAMIETNQTIANENRASLNALVSAALSRLENEGA